MSPPPPPTLEAPPCQKFACAIQDCLNKNDYQESRCKRQIEDLRKCCSDLFAKGGKSVCCSESNRKQ
ncbi:Cx9C motif-containing protein 4, mitochondrial [Choanephora cucurbitarum]|uniref:Cx9C motif-containing protein 4, mitochondrial n=1 Tax=Choanephora cucurbitarum TaxID=101091 RepID=A0A1C7MYP1_9FUNG|nr:Cx9C motif-containing protein 4, mitochondrial [Choanephora cucurbitarum]